MYLLLEKVHCTELLHRHFVSQEPQPFGCKSVYRLADPTGGRMMVAFELHKKKIATMVSFNLVVAFSMK